MRFWNFHKLDFKPSNDALLFTIKLGIVLLPLVIAGAPDLGIGTKGALVLGIVLAALKYCEEQQNQKAVGEALNVPPPLTDEQQQAQQRSTADTLPGYVVAPDDAGGPG